MNPSDVRRQILGEHERLRERLLALEADLSAAAADAGAETRLRAALGGLSAALREHVKHEEAHLVPALLATDAWGPLRAAQIRAEHANQLDLLAGWERTDGLPLAELAARVRAFVVGLRADMDAEDKDLLHPDVLRDDVISVQQASS